jgi:hypothetical protein
VDDGINLADVAEELVAQTFAFAGTAHQAGNIDKAELGRDNLGRAGNRRQLVEPRIGNADIADVRFDRAERIVGRLGRLGLGQRIKQGRLADIAGQGGFDQLRCGQRGVSLNFQGPVAR